MTLIILTAVLNVIVVVWTYHFVQLLTLHNLVDEGALNLGRFQTGKESEARHF
jgi:hypothetical protein